MKTKTLIKSLALALGVETMSGPTGIAAEPHTKPVLLYSRHYNAEGENRYLPDGTYKQVMQRLREDFEVRMHNKPLTRETLADVKLLFIVNPSDKAVGNNPAPPHVTAADIKVLTEFVRNGGGLIVSGNQENHNLEIADVNRLLAQFGIQATNLYTDAKKLVLPRETPMIGGLRWAYYTGNLLLLDSSHPAKPRALVMNDLNQMPEKARHRGTRQGTSHRRHGLRLARRLGVRRGRHRRRRHQGPGQPGDLWSPDTLGRASA
ncbi:MAG: hypothetical protein DME18_15175 [Verrucomicrobia bacterium]|nr:MAG: hypothetical protein DME18_15175 [Verrucomicrobiota bacterium]